MSTATRIVSLLPAATEFVHLLGLGDSLVGRSHECNAPKGVEALPVCTRSLVADTSGAEIDAEVRQRVADGAPLFEIDTERVRSLAPTHIVTQAKCDVCAIGEEQVDALLADDWPGAVPEVTALSPKTLGDVFSDLTMLGHVLGVPDAGQRAAAELAERVAAVGEQTGARSPRPKVLCLEWLDPPIVAGNWMPELVRVAGGEPVFGQTGQPSKDVSWDEITKVDPDVVILMPCGFDLERTRMEAAALEGVPAWQALRAVANGRAIAVDGDAYFNRPGPRLVDSLELLAEILESPATHTEPVGPRP